MKVRDQHSDRRVLRDLVNSDDIQQAVKDLAKDIQRDARLLAPRRSGNLRRHIEIERTVNPLTGLEGYAVGWGDQAFYGPFVESGGEKNRRPRPHLVPAAIRNGGTHPGGDR